MPKIFTREQLQSRKDKAVRFTRDVLEDDDRADEIENESLEDYAERRGFTITNPSKRNRKKMSTKRELEQQIEELEDENQELQDQLDAVADIVSPEEEEDETGADDEDEDDPGLD